MRDELLISKLEFIQESVDLIQEWFQDIKQADDYLATSLGKSHLDATLMRLQSIGETVKKISSEHPSLLKKHGSIEWHEIIRLREIISHHYEQLSHEIIYSICRDNLPALKRAIQAMLAELKGKPD